MRLITLLLVCIIILGFNVQLVRVDAQDNETPHRVVSSETHEESAEVLESDSPNLPSTINYYKKNPELENIKVKKHKIESDEFVKFKKQVGVSEENTNYNKIVDSHGTGLRPPTEEEWLEIRDSMYVIDDVITDSSRARAFND